MNQDNQELVDSIKTALRGSIATDLTSQSAHSNLYEAYIFTLVLRAADTEDIRVEYESIQDDNPSTLVLRKSPGRISGRTRNFGYAVLHLSGNVRVELHKNVYVNGRSGTDHEADVLLVDRGEAMTCRNDRVTPRHQSVALAVECKHYVDSDIGLDLAREFIGLRGDICVKAHAHFVSNDYNDSVKNFLASKASRNFELEVYPGNEVRQERIRNIFQKRIDNHSYSS